MSTDYTMHVKRCADNKEIASFFCNSVKTIMDSEFAKDFGCPCDYYRTEKLNKKITIDLLENIQRRAIQKIEKLWNEIIEKKFMICQCKEVSVKDSLLEDIQYIKESIDETQYVVNACSYIQGQIHCVTEDLLKRNVPAYTYNGKGLPKQKSVYTNTESDPYVFDCDVYAVLTAS